MNDAKVMAPPTSRPVLTLKDANGSSGRGSRSQSAPSLLIAASPVRSRRRARCGSAPDPSLRRNALTWLSTVRVSTSEAHPHTCSSSASRDDRGPWPAREEGEQVEFGSGQVDFVVTAMNSARLQVDSIVADRYRLRLVTARSTRRSSTRTRATSSRMLNGLVR